MDAVGFPADRLTSVSRAGPPLESWAGNLRPPSRHSGSDALTSWIKQSALLYFSSDLVDAVGFPAWPIDISQSAGNLRPTSRHCGSDALTSWIKHSALLIFSLGFVGRCGIPRLTELNRAGNLHPRLVTAGAIALTSWAKRSVWLIFFPRLVDAVGSPPDRLTSVSRAAPPSGRVGRETYGPPSRHCGAMLDQLSQTFSLTNIFPRIWWTLWDPRLTDWLIQLGWPAWPIDIS